MTRRFGFWVDESTSKVPPHPTESKELLYNRIIINAIRGVLKAQGLRIYIHGAENIPAEGGALLAINHTGYYDFILGGVPALLRGKRLVRFMAKKEIFDTPVVGALMRGMHHASVDRAHGAGSLDDAINRLRNGQLVGIFPEATVSRSFEIKGLKTGAVRIAAAAEVPLIPLIIWGGQRIITKDIERNLGRSRTPIIISVGKPVDPTGEPEAATARLHEAMVTLLDAVRSEYEREFGPFAGGEPWRPASLGGGAPDLERAGLLEIAERERRQAKKAKRRK
ncbi:lysophospholipid acyltransferase family protein [Corynebacterium pacaense]|uniref:lysophospholipid acyltransferase family protein n=1 Tax=Corynebacterium pacaense TaxID=1816684 RepID=UPI0009BC7229|nr:lysophospholipid acyltransferase family protein [Corynebacterium pacaense]